MSRKLFILFIAIFCFTLSANLLADEAEDVQQITELLRKEGMSVWECKPEEVLSCYAPGFVGYHAMPDSISRTRFRINGYYVSSDPEDWVVRITTADELRKYALTFVDKAPRRWEDFIAEHPEWKGNFDVNVNVKGDHAIAVHRGWWLMPDSKDRKTEYSEWRSVWMLARIKREWKITNWISNISRCNWVRNWVPEE